MATKEEFVQTVQQMRDAQKSYFKTRNKGALIRSKQLESAVDKMIVQLEKQWQWRKYRQKTRKNNTPHASKSTGNNNNIRVSTYSASASFKTHISMIEAMNAYMQRLAMHEQTGVLKSTYEFLTPAETVGSINPQNFNTKWILNLYLINFCLRTPVFQLLQKPPT